MRYREIVQIVETVIDFDPEKTRDLFDLDLKASRGVLTPDDLKAFAKFLRDHKNDDIQLYHGTLAKNDVPNQGLLPTSARRRRSIQSGSGYVYLTYDPNRALRFAEMGYPGQRPVVVYAVTVPIKNLRPDPDQLRNKRMWGERSDIGGTLADSMIYGAGARVKGKIEPWRIKVWGTFGANGEKLD